MTPTNTPLPDLSGLKKADIDLLHDLGARLGRGEVIGGTPYAVKCWQAIGRFEALIAKVEALEGKEEVSARAESKCDGAHPIASDPPLSTGLSLSFDELEDLHAAVAGVITAQERYVSDEGHRWERLKSWLTRLAIAANDQFAGNWKGLPPAESSPSGAQRSEQALSAPDAPKSNSGADQ